MDPHKIFDVIIIGGSYSGLSAAMALGRSLREVLIIDSGDPCNKQTPHSHNFITQDGSTPSEIALIAKEQVMKYETITFISGIAVSGGKDKDRFKVNLLSGEYFYARKLLFATGMKDIFPDIPGFAECWGISVLHCPYCHGYEVRNEPIGVIGNGDMGFDFAKLISNWTHNLTLYTNGKSELSEEQAAKLATHKIAINEKVIRCFKHRDGYIQYVEFSDGSRDMPKAIFGRGGLKQHCAIPKMLGCEFTEHGFIKIDDFHRTTVPGVYAAGDNSNGFRAVSIAVAAGTMAGAVINKDLLDEKFY